jgi:hypothetical protein
VNELTNQFTWHFIGRTRRVLGAFVAHGMSYFSKILVNYKVLLFVVE